MDSAPATFRFGDFTLDEAARELRLGDTPVPLKPRYFDALVLMLRCPEYSCRNTGFSRRRGLALPSATKR